MVDRNEFSMVQEASDLYEIRTMPDGRTEIRIIVSQRFAELWMTKLSELRGSFEDVVSER